MKVTWRAYFHLKLCERSAKRMHRLYEKLLAAGHTTVEEASKVLNGITKSRNHVKKAIEYMHPWHESFHKLGEMLDLMDRKAVEWHQMLDEVKGEEPCQQKSTSG